MVSFKIDVGIQNTNTEYKNNWKVKYRFDLADDKYKYKVYLDDTLRDLKTKIAHYLLNEKKIKISIDEIYIFYTSEDIYNAALAETQLIDKNISDGSIMNRERVKLLNVNIDENEYSNVKFTLSDKAIKSWDNPSEKIKFHKPLTINPVDKYDNYDYTFSVNPFNINTLDKTEGVELYNSSKNVNARNAERLIDCNFIKDKKEIITIQVVLLEDALKFVETNDKIDNGEFIKLYYPYFKKHNIFTIDKLKEKRDMLAREFPEEEDFIFKYYEIIDKLNDIGDNYNIENKVKNIELTLKNKYNMKFPMESIFNNIHANHEIEVIKYNPGYKREPVYRIYSKCLNEKGEKIPYVGKRYIINSTRSSVSNDEIGMVIKPRNNDIYENLLLNFNSEGQAVIKGYYNMELKTESNIIKLDNFEDSIKDVLKSIIHDTKPKIDYVNDFLELTGYEISGFDDDNLDIFMLKTVDLVYTIKVNHKITNSEFKKHITPFESVFLFETFDINKDGAVARFKRVNNYREPSMDEEIVELIDKNEEDNVIKDYIKNKYKLNDINAIQEIERVKVDEMYDTVKNKKQGFKVNIKQMKEDKSNILVFNVQNVNSFDYVKILEKYIISLSQHLSKTNKKLEQLGNALKGFNIEIEQQDDIKQDSLDSFDSALDLKEYTADGYVKDENNVNEMGDAESIDLSDIDTEEEEEEEEEEVSGGNSDIKSHADVKKYFDTLKYKKDKDVFGDIAYSRTCLNNQDKQPIPISKSEYDKIKETKIKYKKDKNGNGINENIKVLNYENNSDKADINYICPRYWDISNNEMIAQEDFKNKYKTEEEQRKVLIPKDKKKTIPDGAHIYQFYDRVVHKSLDDDKYINTIPYWTSEEILNIDGTSYGPFPCCGTKYKQQDKKIDDERGYYVIDYESSKRLKQKQLGFLPPSLEKIFGIKKEDIVKKENRHELKSNTNTILRMGGNKSKNQSFISCMANVYLNPYKVKEILANEEMKKIIIEKYLTIDKYIYFNRGMLFSTFLPSDYQDKYENIKKTQLNKYKESSFYKEFVAEETYSNVDGDEKKQIISDMTTFFKMLVVSFDEFNKYISKDNTVLDHTLMLDIMLNIFKHVEKIDNIIIFEIDDNDELNILCPMNINSKFKENGNTIMLLKRGNLYENLCNNKKKFNFIEDNTQVLSKINDIVKKINETRTKRNYPMGLIPPILIQDIKNIKGYTIDHQIINNQFLTIGVVLKKIESTDSNPSIFVPCASEPPEIIDNKINVDHVDAYQDHIKSIEETIDFYKDLNMLNIKITLSQVLYYDDIIYGFITNTLQFVKVKPISINDFKELNEYYKYWGKKLVNIRHYYSADRVSTIAQLYNEEKHKSIQNVRLETTYYNVFRSILRHIIANEGKTNKRDKIKEIKELMMGSLDVDDNEVNSKTYTNNKKHRQKLEEKLKELMKDRITFIDMEQYKRPKRYTDITSCIRKNVNVEYCDDTKLIIPIRNLNNNNIVNSQFYYTKIVDELMRFPQVRKYMLEPNQYLNIGSDTLKVNDDEIIMLENVILDTLPNVFKRKDEECMKMIIPYKSAIPQKITK